MHHFQPGVAVFVFDNSVKICFDGISIANLAVMEFNAFADVKGISFSRPG